MGANQIVFVPVHALTWLVGCILLIAIILVSVAVLVIRRHKAI